MLHDYFVWGTVKKVGKTLSQLIEEPMMTAGTFDFVPAKMVQIEGVWYTAISSYSNSVYLVADNKVSFTDVQKHL